MGKRVRTSAKAERAAALKAQRLAEAEAAAEAIDRVGPVRLTDRQLEALLAHASSQPGDPCLVSARVLRGLVEEVGAGLARMICTTLLTPAELAALGTQVRAAGARPLAVAQDALVALVAAAERVRGVGCR